VASPRNRGLPELPLTSPAQDSADEHIERFADLLVSQAEILAHQQEAEIIIQPHIDQAREILSQRKQKPGRLGMVLTSFGGIFFGVFVRGLLADLNVPLAVYAVFGSLGTLLICIGLFRE
jgi:hypothetical protein